MDFLAVEALVADQHPRAEGAHCGELFHCETNMRDEKTPRALWEAIIANAVFGVLLYLHGV